MPRPLAFRLGTASAAFVFITMGGVTGVELHPLSQHGMHSGDIIAIELGAVPEALGESHTSVHQASYKGGHEAQHSQEGLAHSGVTDGGPRWDSEMHHAGHHSRHPQHGSSENCTCIGACVGGAAPTLTSALLFKIPGGEIDLLRVVRATVLLIRQDPTSYLFPLPNAPPLQA